MRRQELDRAAQTAFDRGQFAQAAQRYREAACLVPESGRALYGLGIAEAASGNLAGGRKALEKAAAILPGNGMPLAMLVRVDVALKNIDRVKEVQTWGRGEYRVVLVTGAHYTLSRGYRSHFEKFIKLGA